MLRLNEIKRVDPETFDVLIEWRGRERSYRFCTEDVVSLGFFIVKTPVEFHDDFAEYEPPGEVHRCASGSSALAARISKLVGEVRRGGRPGLPIVLDDRA